MEDFINVECLEQPEIDWDYEFDAAWFYDFCRPESPSEAAEAQRWFETAGNYPPSPLIVKLNLRLEKDTPAEYSSDPSRLREEKTAKSSSNNSNIHTGSAVSPSNPKIEGALPDGRMGCECPKPKIESEPSSLKARGSTLMKPTASYLAKQRSQKTPSETSARSSWNSSGSYIVATKRQKLERGYLRKVTVPKDPQLETMQRAQRRRLKSDLQSNDQAKAKAETSKARPVNIKIHKAPALPPHPKTTLRSPESNLSNSHHTESTTNSTSMDLKRPNTQNAEKQVKYVALLKSKVLRCHKDSKSVLDERQRVHPPVEMFNKLSLRSEKETSAVSQQKSMHLERT